MSSASAAESGAATCTQAQEQTLRSVPSPPGEPAPRLDPIDRWAALYQRARLWKRRAHRAAAGAVAGGNYAAIRTALRRLRRARQWEAFCRDHYLGSILACYC